MDWVYELSDMCSKFGLAVALAGLIGLERQLTGHAAGLRTHIIVCLGATLMMTVTDHMIVHWGGNSPNAWAEKARVAAGIITGIGFLGAGAIVNVGSVRTGLTTAAMIWFVAALGIAIGMGATILASVSTAFVLMIARGFDYLERWLPTFGRFTMTVHMKKGLEHLHDIERALHKAGYRATASRIRVTDGGEYTDMTFDLHGSAGLTIEEVSALVQRRFPSAESITFER